MTGTLMFAAILALTALIALAGALLFRWADRKVTRALADADTYFAPHPEPPDWVNDARRCTRPTRRGDWRQNCEGERR